MQEIVKPETSEQELDTSEQEFKDRLLRNEVTETDYDNMKVKNYKFVKDIMQKKEPLNDTEKELIRRIIRISPIALRDNVEELILERNIRDLIYGWDKEGMLFVVHENIQRMIEQFNSTNKLEDMLILHIVMCYLNLLDSHWQHCTGTFFDKDRDKEFNSVQKRFLRAIETLAKIRKHDLKLQVNIAGKDGKQVIIG